MKPSIANPKGYGTPIVGLFNNNGALIAYGGLLKDSVVGEHTFIIGKCSLEDNEEDGITANITIDGLSVNLIDSPIFNQGNTLVVKFGYLQDEEVGFGRPYYLIIKDYQVKYGETISHGIELVDEKTFTSLTKPDSNEILDQTRQAILEAEGEELDVSEYTDALSKESKTELRKVFKQLNEIRNNFKERSGEYVYQYKGAYYATWDDLNSFLRSPYAKRDNEFYQIRSMTPQARAERYRVKVEELNWLGRTNVKIGRFLNGNRGSGILGSLRNQFKPVKDLYGFSVYTREGRHKWIQTLKESGFMFYATEGYSRPIKSVVYDSRGNLNESAIDEIIDILISDATLARVEADMNLSNYNNLEKYLRSLVGGPHIITDKGDGNGVVVKTRDLDASPYMVLHYKGGSGDLLDVSIDTDFGEPEYVESESMTIDPETGEMIAVTDISHNQVAGDTSGAKAYVNATMNAISQGKEVPNKQDFYRQELPGVNYHTESPSYINEETGFYTSAVDNTRFSRVLPGTSFDVKPDSIEDILAEIENKKGDLNLKRIIADANLLGNPAIRSGMNFYLKGVANRFTGKYYALNVTHSIDPNSGYTTKLELGKIPDIQTSAKQVTRQKEEVKDGERRWVYSKARLIEFNENDTSTGKSYRSEPIGPPDNRVLFTDPRVGVSGYYNAETGGVWPVGVNPTELINVIDQSKKDYKTESDKFRKMSYDPAASVNDELNQKSILKFKLKEPQTIIKQRKPKYNE